MRILIYESNLNGHRLEYLHHLYELAVESPEHQFFFVLSDQFNEVKDMFHWGESSNVTIDLFQAEREQPLGRRETVRELKDNAKKTAKSLNKYIEKYGVNRIFAISIIKYIPYLYKQLPKDVTVDGILYSVFPSKERRFPMRYVDYVKYGMFRLSSHFSNIYVLNDRESAEKLNRQLFTSKFKYIPDPFTPLKSDKCQNLREKLGISNDKVVFIHFGGLQKRKGTMLIMESIKMLSPEEKKKYVFIFAGKVYDEMRQEFYQAYNELKDSVQIILKDEFCSYDFLASLCTTCDCILIPYLVTTQSSGIVGYASQFHKPVIAPCKDIIGRLVDEYKLGYMLPKTTAEELVKAYRKVEKGCVEAPTLRYCEVNSIRNFQNVIRNGFKN